MLMRHDDLSDAKVLVALKRMVDIHIYIYTYVYSAGGSSDISFLYYSHDPLRWII